MRYFFDGECCFCLHSDSNLLRCTECEKLFHKDRCGTLPRETEYEHSDPDNFLPGTSFVGRRGIPMYGDAKCGNCLRFDDERRRFVEIVIPEATKRLDQVREEMRVVDTKLAMHDEGFEKIREEILEREALISDLRRELEVEREWWRRLDRMVRSGTVENSETVEQFQAITVELGQAIAYQEHVVQGEIYARKRWLEAALEEMQGWERELQRLNTEAKYCDSLINRYSLSGNHKH